jgi:catechol-2,3-dioxygenase
VDEPHAPLTVAAVSLDCADHRELAAFYQRLLGGELLWEHENASAVRCGGLVLVPQQVVDHQPPSWPGASIVHLDLNGDGAVDDLADHAVSLGARLAVPQPDPRWRVMLDPAGHPFCITPFAP